MRRGTLERVPQTPQNFSRICYNTRIQPPGMQGAKMRRGTLERVPQTPQNFPRFVITPGFSPPPAREPPPLPSAARVQPPSGCLYGMIVQCRKRFSPRGCKGRSPLHKITLVSPFPLGRGAGGWGQKSIDKAGKPGDQSHCAPRRTPTVAKQSDDQNRRTPLRVRALHPIPAPPGFSLGDARGEAPCIKKLWSPPSRREGGRGDGGKKTAKVGNRPATKTASPPPGA